jgi:hypothetical protein
MSDTKFIDGFFCKKPSEKAPQFIKGKVSIKKDKFINWLNTQETEWVNIDILESQKGEFYGKVDEWKPNAQPEQKDSTTSDFDEIKAIREQHNSQINNNEGEISASDIPF